MSSRGTARLGNNMRYDDGVDQREMADLNIVIPRFVSFTSWLMTRFRAMLSGPSVPTTTSPAKTSSDSNRMDGRSSVSNSIDDIRASATTSAPSESALAYRSCRRSEYCAQGIKSSELVVAQG